MICFRGLSFIVAVVSAALPALAAAQTPDPPSTPRVDVIYNTVTVSWAPASTGPSPTHYFIIGGQTPGGSELGVHPVGAATVVTANLPNGMYFARVIAANGAGQSVPSGEVQFRIGGDRPGSPRNVVIETNDDVVELSWDPPMTGGQPTHYVLVAGSSPGQQDIGALNVGQTTSLSIPVPPGTYFLRVIAVNQIGSSDPSPETMFVVGPSAIGPSPWDGTWQGTTSQGVPIAFIVENRRVKTVVVTGRFNGGICVSTVQDSTKDLINTQGQFSDTRANRPRSLGWSLLGTITTNTNASGTINITANPSGSFVCSGTVSSTWSATNFGVGAPLIPRAPTGLTASVSGSTATVTWTPPSGSDPPVTSYSLAVGSGSGASNVGVFTFSPATSYTTPALPTGTYYARLIAHNQSGASAPSNEVTFTTSDPQPPSPPTGLTVSPSSTSATFSWAPSSGAASYDVEIGTSSGNSNVGVFTATITTYTQSLSAGSYFARVRARNATGVSAPSNEVSLTIAAPLPGAPSALQQTVSGTTASFTWSAPTSGGPVGSYDVEIGTASGSSNIGAFTATITSFSRTLSAGNYFVRVRARNSSGVGPASNEVSFSITTASVPGAPTSLTVTVSNGTTVSMTWSAPTTGGTPTSYDVEFGTSSGASNVVVDSVTTTSHTRTGQPATYYARVRARNASGVSAASNEVTFTLGTTLPPVPGPPSNLQRTVSGSTVTFTWAAPTTGGAVTSYEVEIGTAPGTSNTGIFTTTALTYTNGTLPANTYYARVRARNAGGTGNASNEVSFTIASALPPGVPSALAATTTSSSVTFTWAAPTSGGAPTSYDVEIGTTSGSSNIGTFTATQTTFTRTLSAGTYYARVRARNVVGVSAPSNQISFTISTTTTALTFAWEPPTSGATVTSYDLEVGTGPGLSNVGVYNTTQLTHTTPPLANGTYYARVRGRNALGAGEATTELVVTLPLSTTTTQGQSVVFLP
jgi:predicted phage tail protein